MHQPRLGFQFLAFSHNGWVFIAGIAIFSLGEMIAHPKYYSFVGLVAPEAKKALYMGYSFLYGVFGALIGSSLGAFLYARFLKPAIGQPHAAATARNFWLMFTALDALAALGLILFAWAFSADTPETRRQSRKWMIGVYGAVFCLGLGFAYAALSAHPVEYRTLVQSLIFLAMGGGGLTVILRQPKNINF